MPAKKNGGAPRASRDDTLRRFATRTLTAYGAHVAAAEHGCLAIEPGALAPVFGRSRFVLAFDRAGLVHHDDAHMVATGSPMLGRLLAVARHGGATTRWRYAAVNPAPAVLPGTREAVAGAGKRTWVRVYRLHILAAIHAAEHAQQLVTLVWDPQSHACLDGADLPQGDPTFDPPARTSAAGPRTTAALGAELRTALEQSHTLIESRLRKTVKRLQLSAEELLEQRLNALAAYYRELLAEEGDRKGRARTATDGERAKRLKLEWERKISTEREHVAPRGTLRLVAIEELWTPRTTLALVGEPASRVALWDHAAGAVIRVSCRRCGVRHATAHKAPRGGFVCTRCARLENAAQ